MLVISGHEKLRIPPIAHYFSGISAAGVRSNILNATLLLPSRLEAYTNPLRLCRLGASPQVTDLLDHLRGEFA
jgi:hypothetical protein